MSVNGVYGSTGSMRIGGLASGLDTDSIVKDLINIEQMKVDKIKQEKQVAEWQKEQYRDISNLLRGFKDEYFDIINDDNYMLSQNTYRTFDVTSSNESYITATANASANTGSYSIESITSIATAASLESSSSVSAPLQGTTDVSGGASLNGVTFSLKVDGVSKSLEFTSDYASIDDIVIGLQDLVDDAFGENRVQVGKVDGKYISLNSENSVVEVYLGELGFESGQTNRLNTSDTLANLSTANPSEAAIEFTINNVDFSFDSSDKLSDIMSEINNSNAGVRLSYSTLTDTFSLTAKDTGAGENIIIENTTGNFFGTDSVTGITDLVADNGTNAVLSINGQTVTRSSNTFTADGVTYSINEAFDASNGPVTLKIEQDVEAAYEKIESFVNKYNEVVDKINNKLDEKRYRDYQPLTESQRESMSENEIEMWEEKAKSGLLRNDTILESVVHEMRTALFDSVENAGINLSSIGIKTGSYSEKGKLHITEDTLKTALRENGDQIMDLFSKQSDVSYSPNLSSTERTQRYNESGLMHRISDILKDTIRTTRDDNGNKGSLLEKAGIIGDVTEFENLMDDKIDSLDKRIDNALDIMYQKEDRYWEQFSALETAMNRMNQQSAWLMQQFSSGQ